MRRGYEDIVYSSRPFCNFHASEKNENYLKVHENLCRALNCLIFENDISSLEQHHSSGAVYERYMVSVPNTSGFY
jgi:hypothetical protein